MHLSDANYTGIAMRRKHSDVMSSTGSIDDVSLLFIFSLATPLAPASLIRAMPFLAAYTYRWHREKMFSL